MRLYVTQEDIDNGAQCMASKCAVARAFTRATGIDCQVGSSSIWISGRKLMGLLDEVGTKTVTLFDWERDLCRPAVIEISFPSGCTEPALLRDYVPSTELADKIKELAIPGRPLPRMEYAH